MLRKILSNVFIYAEEPSKEVKEMSEEERKDREASGELKELAELLKETIIELRNIADQLGNPLVPPPVTAPKSTEQIEKVQPRPQQSQREEEKKGFIPQKVMESSTRIGTGSISNIYEGEKGRKEPYLESPASTSKIGEASKLLRLVRLIYELSDRVPPEYFSKLAEFIGGLGLTSKDQVEALKNLIEIVKMGNEYGLSLEENLALLALTLKELGIREDEIVDEVLRRVIKKQGVGKWENQQQ